MQHFLPWAEDLRSPRCTLLTTMRVMPIRTQVIAPEVLKGEVAVSAPQQVHGRSGAADRVLVSGAGDIVRGGGHGNGRPHPVTVRLQKLREKRELD